MNEHDILITRDTKGKIRVVDISCEWSEILHAYVINRQTSQFGGKITQQPLITISKGKASRTVTEQATLEYKSHIKKYLDKGYKNITEFGYTSLDQFDPYSVFPEIVVDQNGAKKIMNAKAYDKVATSYFEKLRYASKKLDGVRCTTRCFHESENDQEWSYFKTASRGGGNYDIPSQSILNEMFLNDELIDWFHEHPDFALDGELYIHGRPLPYISGLCRKITYEEKHDELQYHVYDIMCDSLTFNERLELLEELKEILKNSSKIIICDHIPTESWGDVKKLHDMWVKEGYEGCVLRDPSKEYGYGKRDNRMVKVKEFQDDEFLITGMTEGKLRDEDFVFNLVTKDGKSFEAKPIGDRELRQEYMDNLESIIGQMGTVKFFGYTPDGIPNLPIFKYVRYGEDNG